MRKLLYVLALTGLSLLVPHQAHAACTVVGLTYTAASASQTDVQACVTAASGVCGATIAIPSGSGTWSTQVAIAAPTGCAMNQGVTLQGATVCTGGCAAGSGGVGLAFTDNTNITLSSGGNNLIFTGCGTNSFCTLTGITFIAGTGLSSNGAIDIQGLHGQVGFRAHHFHFTNTFSGGVLVLAYNGYGLIDHYLSNDTAANPADSTSMGGDFSSNGYKNWNDTTNLGTNQAIYVEDSQANMAAANGEGFFDGYYGCKVVIRYNVINGNQIGGWHGTDSGGDRGCVYGEIYNNTVVNNHGSNDILNTRSGIIYFYNNNISGTGVTSGIPLQYYRLDNPSAAEQQTWGALGYSGAIWALNWTPIKVSTGNTCGSVDCIGYVTANAPAWTPSHGYTCSTSAPCIIGPTSNNTGVSGAGGFNFATATSCTSSGTQPNPWNQTVSGTQSDGTCTWVNVGGGTTASPAPGTANGFCILNPDTAASANSTCNALSTGDMAGRYLDCSTGLSGCTGTYPARDQPGVGHNQVSMPNYSWSNTLPAGIPATSLFTGDGTVVQSGRDYFNNTTAPGYTAYTYPDPLQGGTASRNSHI